MREFVIWSKFGLWRSVTEAELSNVVDAEPAEVLRDVDSKGFCLTWCDVEPVAVLPEYPEGEEPAEVLAWFEQADWEPDGNE
jgi:hypothetical protein